MSTPLVQIRCTSLRSKSSYGAFGEFHDELLDLSGATMTYWCLKTMGKAGRSLRSPLSLPGGALLLGKLRERRFD
jgi:hypothetical protein